MTTDAPPTPCALAHAVPGRHLDGCDDPDCPGCLPALALDRTKACGWHTGRVRRALGDAPDLVAHLHELIEPGSGAGEERVTRGELAPPAPLSVDALSAADDLIRVLASWTARLASANRLHGPVEPPRSLERRPRQARTCVGLCQWLLAHQDAALSAPWTAAYVRDVTTEVASVRARYPLEERPVWLPVPCPACGSNSLARWAPRWVGAPVTIACELDDCRTTVDEDRYPWLVRLAADLAKDRR